MGVSFLLVARMPKSGPDYSPAGENRVAFTFLLNIFHNRIMICGAALPARLQKNRQTGAGLVIQVMELDILLNCGGYHEDCFDSGR